ncbi:pilin [bacterium]|nr:pilin [bacterium]
MFRKIFFGILIALTPLISLAAALTNPLGSNDPREIIGTGIAGAFSIMGSLALVMFIYGGFQWMLSGGNQEKVTKGKNILTWAFFGLLIIFSSYVILRFILGEEGFLSPFLII